MTEGVGGGMKCGLSYQKVRKKMKVWENGIHCIINDMKTQVPSYNFDKHNYFSCRNVIIIVILTSLPISLKSVCMFWIVVKSVDGKQLTAALLITLFFVIFLYKIEDCILLKIYQGWSFTPDDIPVIHYQQVHLQARFIWLKEVHIKVIRI